MTAFLYRPPIRRTIQTLFWVTAGTLGSAFFIASVWAYAIVTGAGIE